MEEFRKLQALLNPGGRLILVFQPRWAKSKEEIRSIAAETETQFGKAGFKQVEVEFKK